MDCMLVIPTIPLHFGTTLTTCRVSRLLDYMDDGRTRQLHHSSLSTNLATRLSPPIAFLLVLPHNQAQEQYLLLTQDILAQISTHAKDYAGDN